MLDGLGQHNEARQLYQDILKQDPDNAPSSTIWPI